MIGRSYESIYTCKEQHRGQLYRFGEIRLRTDERWRNLRAVVDLTINYNCVKSVHVLIAPPLLLFLFFSVRTQQTGKY